MIASSLLSQLISPLHINDTGEEAINTMGVYHVKHLPIVSQEKLVGLISEDDILAHNLDDKISTYRLSVYRPFCFENEHIFEVIQKMAANKLTIIPVIDRKEKYLGLISLEDIILFYGESYSFKEPGSILVLEVARHNYSLAEIARITESEGILIISSFITTIEDSTNMLVTLKLNSHDLHRLTATFQRFDYAIGGTFTEDDYIDTLKDRYDSLMSYLNV